MGQGMGSDWSWINATANRFERAWKDGLRPRIEDYLTTADESRRPWLLEELLRVEWELRRAKVTLRHRKSISVGFPVTERSSRPFLTAASPGPICRRSPGALE